MKSTTLPIEGLNLDRLLQEAGTQDVVFLRTDGEIRFALIRADEGDQEVLALKSNAEFMAYLTDCKKRSNIQSRVALQQVREKYGLPPSDSNGPAPT